MKFSGVSVLAFAALAGFVAASPVHADPSRVRPAPTLTTPATAPVTDNTFVPRTDAPGQLGPQAPRRSLQWDSVLGRWGVKLDMDQPNGREVELRDVQTGAYYSLTNRLRLGGSVTLGAQPQAPRNTDPQPAAPRVRLESAFKF